MALDEVASEAGISRTLVFHYFPTKGDFYAAVVQSAGEHLLRPVVTPEGASADERVRILVEGFVRLVDRKKDMILVSGFNVYPNEVEDVIAMMPGVLEVAAIGVPDDKSGEAVKVFVVKKDSSLTADQVKAFCREQLTGYKQPRFVEFRDELPKSNVGKILRKELREPAKAS